MIPCISGGTDWPCRAPPPPKPTHTHHHTHARARARAGTHARSLARTHARTRIRTHAHAQAPKRARTHNGGRVDECRASSDPRNGAKFFQQGQRKLWRVEEGFERGRAGLRIAFHGGLAALGNDKRRTNRSHLHGVRLARACLAICEDRAVVSLVRCRQVSMFASGGNPQPERHYLENRVDNGLGSRPKNLILRTVPVEYLPHIQVVGNNVFGWFKNVQGILLRSS